MKTSLNLSQKLLPEESDDDIDDYYSDYEERN
jgi:hypothetical protein